MSPLLSSPAFTTTTLSCTLLASKHHRITHSFTITMFNSVILLLLLGCFTASRFKNKYLSRPKTSLVSFLKRLFFSPSTSVPSPSSSINNNNRAVTPPRGDRDIHPCSLCGELFRTLALLQHHQSTNHAVSELADGENIVRIIFKMGWPEKARSPTISRILKIHSRPKTTARFEEYRERVKSRAESDERCAADGNELLRFYCATFTCDLGSGVCGQHYCSACGVIRSGFSQKMDGVSTMPTSWRAHGVIPEDMEEEFSFMHVKRALLVCRVIAGRVGCVPDPGYDSWVGGDDDELVVSNPWAVLPCFVIVYTV